MTDKEVIKALKDLRFRYHRSYRRASSDNLRNMWTHKEEAIDDAIKELEAEMGLR